MPPAPGTRPKPVRPRRPPAASEARRARAVGAWTSGTLALAFVAAASAGCSQGIASPADETQEETAPPPSPSPAVAECQQPRAEWIFCDDFEEDRSGAYFEHADASGSFVRAQGAGREGSAGMRTRFEEGQVSAGFLHLAFGRTPDDYIDPVDQGTRDYQEVFWRFYVRNQEDWTGGGGHKLTRATALVTSGWAQTFIAPVWSGGKPSTRDYLVLDPVSGTDEAGRLQTTKYNDSANLRWLGGQQGQTPLFDEAYVGEWHCVEVRVRLNAPGTSDGVFELWVDGRLDASRTGLNWVGDYDDYGINAVFLENYWNGGAPRVQERYLDNLVVSTEPIGC